MREEDNVKKGTHIRGQPSNERRRQHQKDPFAKEAVAFARRRRGTRSRAEVRTGLVWPMRCVRSIACSIIILRIHMRASGGTKERRDARGMRQVDRSCTSPAPPPPSRRATAARETARRNESARVGAAGNARVEPAVAEDYPVRLDDVEPDAARLLSPTRAARARVYEWR